MARWTFRRPILALALLAAGGAVLFVHLSLAEPARVRLVELAGAARARSEGGEFPIFARERRLRQDLTVSGETLESLTPPFPSRLEFDVRLPSSPTLDLAISLVTVQEVSRARVRFSVEIETAEERELVFERVLTSAEANQWEAIGIGLNRWAGRDVVLVLAASAVPEREGILWANRVQTAWGDPSIRSETGIASAASGLDAWLRSRVPSLERTAPGEPGEPGEDDWPIFALNSLLAGLLSLAVSLVHRLSPGREGLPSGLTSFTLSMMLVAATVHASVPLSLGLLGALSMLRFRAAIPSGGELLYFLLCIAIALPLGVNRPLLGLVVVVTALVVAAVTRLTSRTPFAPFRLTASGRWSGNLDARIEDAFASISETMEMESLEVGGGRFQMSAHTSLEGSRGLLAVLSDLRGIVPDLEVSVQAIEVR
ncbi:MAG TPA: DUF4956 domain-containing protein [Vicinamibacteria bacterium]